MFCVWNFIIIYLFLIILYFIYLFIYLCLIIFYLIYLFIYLLLLNIFEGVVTVAFDFVYFFGEFVFALFYLFACLLL